MLFSYDSDILLDIFALNRTHKPVLELKNRFQSNQSQIIKTNSSRFITFFIQVQSVKTSLTVGPLPFIIGMKYKRIAG